MEFGAAAATSTVSKKLSNGYGVSGKSAYDGVFATPIKFRAHGVSSRFEDYREIFGGSEASLGSSIPILEVPELNERKNLDDRRCSKLDYSTVFGGFENFDAAVPYEELFAEPKKKVSSHKEARSLAKGGKQIRKEETIEYSKEDPLVPQEASVAGTRKVNMSYHKLSQGSENRTNGTTHIAQLHAVPAHTHLIEEVNPPKMNRADQSVPVSQDANLNISGCKGRIKESGHGTESVTGPSPHSANERSSDGGSKAHNRSHSIHLFFDAPEISNGSDQTKFNKVSPSDTVRGNLDNHNDDDVRSMATKYQIPNPDASQGANGTDSPSYDDMVDSNSEVAASVAALRKAIEEAQERINVAKESMKRKKEGFNDRLKRRFNNDLKAEGKKEAKFPSKTVRVGGTTMWQTFGEIDASPQVATEIGKPMMRAGQVTPDFRAKEIFVAAEAVTEVQMKSKFTEVEHKMEEVEWKKADHKATVIEIKQEDNDKEVLHTADDYQRNDKNTGKNAFEKPEQFIHTIEVIKGPAEGETTEGNASADNEACRGEHLVDENEYGSKEILDETKLAQQTPNYEAEDKRLEVDQYKEDIENKVGLVLGLVEDQARKQCNRQLVFNMEDAEKKSEGCTELEECQSNLSAHKEPVVIEQKIPVVQEESEEKVQVYGELEECELSELPEPIDNEEAINLECSELKSKVRHKENLRCVEDQNINNEADFLDINREIEHSIGREEIENSSGNMEETGGDIHGEEEIQDRIKNNRESDGNEKPITATENDKELEGTSYLVEENKRGRTENGEQAELTRVIETGPNYEEEKAEDADKTLEPSPMYEPDEETENSDKMEEADISIENDETQEITSELDELDYRIEASNASFQHEEKYEEPEAVQETNDLGEKHTLEAPTFTQGSLELDEDINQMQDKNGIVAFDSAATLIRETVIQVEQNEGQCLKEAESDGNLAMHIEETTFEYVENCRDAKEAEVGLNEEINKTPCAFSDEEKLLDDECNGEASQLPSMPEWKLNTSKDQQIKRNRSNLKENQQATLTMEEKKATGTSQKVVLEKEHIRIIDEAKEREREREKEKLAVERAIREARERAFAEARERAALERAATEARRKNTSDGHERLGKTTGQASEKTLTEKAAMEAKRKAERAAVERATAEARARALERALSEKAASVARSKSEKFVSEKSDGTSRDNGTKQNFYSKSFSYGDESDGANGDSARRCKARSERHQRIGERVAKALAEKNMRDRLVQKEQEERNRVAETLDADVKRWSSGKEGNLRALLSTLQYILGPDSGWQPIPLTYLVTATAVKKAYRKATLFVHPDKLQQRGASIQQKYTCEKVFDLLKEAWNKFNIEER